MASSAGGAQNDPPGDGGAHEAAHYLKGSIADMSLLARRHRLEMLAYLLDMAHLEAEEILRLRSGTSGR